MKPGSKVAKLRFEINACPHFKPYNGSTLLNAISGTEELEIFELEVVRDFIDFKFESFAKKIHLFGFCIHMVTIGLLMYYVNATFMGNIDMDPLTGRILNPPKASKTQMYCLLMTMLYPTIFDGNQFLKEKVEYLKDPWNYIDILHITMGFLNIYLQLNVGTMHFISKVVFIIVFLTSMIKLFFFLRIFDSLTYIVTMLVQVSKDL